MPSNFLYIDTNFPTFTGEETSKEQIDSMLNYLRILVEQLRYTLNNLDMTNFNTQALSDFSDSSTEDIAQELVTLAAQLNQLSQTVAGLSRRVASLEGLQTRVADAEDDIDDLQSRMLTAEGSITSLQSTTLSQQQSINSLTETEGTQNQRLTALELWKNGPNDNDGAAADIAQLRTDVNAATAAAAANAAAISALQTDVQNIGNDVSTLISEMAQLKLSISVDASGNAIFGKPAQRTDIKGNVYINDVPYSSGGNT